MKSHNVETLLLKRLLTHLQNGVIYLGLKKPVTPWIMLPNLESLNSIGSVLNLSQTVSGPIYLTESNKRLLMEFNLISAMYHVLFHRGLF